ncbi:hypothetical protein MNBD_GAMMA06-1036 [hydrothermal vent metagenome]|uniref:Sulfotransferase family protein n=1 Tax=hydrothermal vent metagenome TaxID=652676 RepID=A0A3B0XGY0_9ZZZZ
MNVFILNSGRCGSTTFIKACQHIKNHTAAHESLLSNTGAQRFNYPENHIEADNRLSWLLGRLDTHYGNDAFYVHLTRNNSDVTKSFSKRINMGILKAYEQGILMHEQHLLPAQTIANDYIETVDANINFFLKNKKNKMNISIETAKLDFTGFWNKIDATGDLNKALKEWNINHNASSF